MQSWTEVVAKHDGRPQFGVSGDVFTLLQFFGRLETFYGPRLRPTEHSGSGFHIQSVEIPAQRGVGGLRNLFDACEEIERANPNEDTSIFFDAWNGLPGALIKWFWDGVGDKGICKMMANETNRKVTAKSVVAFYDGKKLKTFVGQISGTVPMKPRGGGFGWDSIFIPEGFDKTFGELWYEKKNEISMRKLAFEKFKKYLGAV